MSTSLDTKVPTVFFFSIGMIQMTPFLKLWCMASNSVLNLSSWRRNAVKVEVVTSDGQTWRHFDFAPSFFFTVLSKPALSLPTKFWHVCLYFIIHEDKWTFQHHLQWTFPKETSSLEWYHLLICEDTHYLNNISWRLKQQDLYNSNTTLSHYNHI